MAVTVGMEPKVNRSPAEVADTAPGRGHGDVDCPGGTARGGGGEAGGTGDGDRGGRGGPEDDVEPAVKPVPVR